MAKKKLSRDEYNIRTLFYYQNKGGIYNEIITCLTRRRSDREFRGLPPTNLVLNEASYQLDTLIATNEDWQEQLAKLENPLTLSVMAILALDQNRKDIFKAIEPVIKRDNFYYPHFKPIIEQSLQPQAISPEALESAMNELEETRTRLAIAENRLVAAEGELANVRQELTEKNNLLATYDDDEEEQPTLDDVLTIDNTIEYIRSRQHYNHCYQLIAMIKDLYFSNRNLTTDEDWNKIQQLEYQMLHQQNDQVVMNVNYNFGGQIVQGVIESPEIKALLNSPNMPVGKDAKEIVAEMLKLYLTNGQQQ